MSHCHGLVEIALCIIYMQDEESETLRSGWVGNGWGLLVYKDEHNRGVMVIRGPLSHPKDNEKMWKGPSC